MIESFESEVILKNILQTECGMLKILKDRSHVQNAYLLKLNVRTTVGYYDISTYKGNCFLLQ